MIELNFQDGLIPVIVQDIATKTVLMIAYANADAINLTKETGFAHYYSRSRKKIWKKGEESGHFQKVNEIRIDCDSDAILYIVQQEGAACHEGYESCFFRDLEGDILLKRMFDPAKVYKKQ